MLAAQVVHAAGESAALGPPLASDTHAVVLAAATSLELRALSARLSKAAIAHVLIEEIDAPFCGEALALGVAPARKEVVRRHLSSLPLLR